METKHSDVYHTPAMMDDAYVRVKLQAQSTNLEQKVIIIKKS